MKVVITNAVLANAGDAAICLGIVAALGERGFAAREEIVVLDNNAAVTTRLYPDLAILQQPLLQSRGGVLRRLTRMMSQFVVLVCVVSLGLGHRGGRLAPAARRYAEADLIISTGGTYLVEHYRVWPRLIELLTVSFGRVPLVLWTQSLGPFYRPSSRFLMRRLLRRAALIMLRDEQSRQHLLALDDRYADKLIVVPDAAFALASGEPESAVRDIAAVISVREWDTALDGRTAIDVADYEQAMRIAATRLASGARGARVLALSTCQGLPEYGVDDSVYASRLLAALPGVDVDHDFHRPEDLIRLLRRTKVVVATRLHLAILALLAGCQVAAIAYEFKTLELFRACGLDRYVIVLADCTPEAVLGVLDVIDADPHAGTITRADVERFVAAAVPTQALRAAIAGGVSTGSR